MAVGDRGGAGSPELEAAPPPAGELGCGALGGRMLTRCRQQGHGLRRCSPGGQGTRSIHSALAEMALGFGDDLLDTTPKALSMKEITDQLDAIKMKASRSAQDDGRKRGRKPQTGRKHVQNTYLIKDHCPNI